MMRAILGFTVLASAVLGAVQQPPPYRAAADLVSVYATVVDARGRHVPTLEKGSFTVYDNGQPQDITAFGTGVLPFSIVVMLDRSGSMEDHFGAVEDATVDLIRRLDSKDAARIGMFSTDVSIRPAEFTSNHDQLIRLARDREGSHGGSPVWVAIEQSIAAVAAQTNRRVVLVVSDGRSDEHPRQARLATDEAISKEVMLYAIGLTSKASTQLMGYSFIPEQPRFPIPGRDRLKLPAPRRQPSAPAQKPDPLLEKAAEETGGGYFAPKNHDELAQAVTNIVEELHHQYWLGFVPKMLDGTTHHLTVRVNEPGLRVRARQSYVADLAK